MTDTLAIGVIDQNIVIDCGTHEEALRLVDRVTLDPRPAPDTALREAVDLAYELALAYHQTGSLRDHADPKDKTGWNLKGIETCDDSMCVEAVSLRAALATADREEES